MVALPKPTVQRLSTPGGVSTGSVSTGVDSSGVSSGVEASGVSSGVSMGVDSSSGVDSVVPKGVS